MAITITPKQFKQETRSFWHERPSALCSVDRFLATYYAERHTDRMMGIIATLTLMQSRLRVWTSKHTKIQDNNTTRYNSVRDKTGFITLLEQQIETALIEANRRFAVQRIPGMAAAYNNNPGTQQNRLAVMANHDARMRAIAREGYNDERGVGPMVDLDEIQFGSIRSISSLFDLDRDSIPSFADESDRLSYNDGTAPVNTITPNGYLIDQAYEAAAYFLELGWRANVRPADIKAAAIAANPLLATSTRVTLAGLYQGLESMGYQGMYFREHCTMESVVDTLLGATPLKPMMVVVGGNTPEFKCIVVSGHRYDALGAGINIYYTATDGLRPHNFVELLNNGSYSDRNFGGIETMATLLPTVGIIKLHT